MPDTYESLKRNNQEIRQVLAGLDQEAEGSGRPDPSTHRHLINRLISMASSQEAAEQRMLPSAVRRLGPDAARLAGQAIGQSQMIKWILATLAAAQDADPEQAGQVSATVAVAWREHIDFEERQVLPLLRDTSAAAAGAGESSGSVTAALNHLRDVAASHDASGPFAVGGAQAPGRG